MISTNYISGTKNFNYKITKNVFWSFLKLQITQISSHKKFLRKITCYLVLISETENLQNQRPKTLLCLVLVGIPFTLIVLRSSGRVLVTCYSILWMDLRFFLLNISQDPTCLARTIPGHRWSSFYITLGSGSKPWLKRQRYLPFIL